MAAKNSEMRGGVAEIRPGAGNSSSGQQDAGML